MAHASTTPLSWSRLRALVRARLARSAYPLAVAALLGGFVALTAWDAAQYDWLRGYDAWHNSRYADVIQRDLRLPTPAETDVWHTPPLFFVLAAGVQAVSAGVGWPADPHQAVQVLNVVAGLGVVVLSFLIARELFPRSRAVQIAALAFAALTPVLVRATVMYHPEPVATLLAMAALYVVVRTLARQGGGLAVGVLAGALIGLAFLTRTWALPVAVALCLALVAGWRFGRDPRLLRTAGALLAVAAAIGAPWLVRQQVEHGSPLAFNRPEPEQPLLERRPAEFYTGLALGDVFTKPYAPHYLNRLLPTVYTDWWGDYWRYFDLPYEQINLPERLERSDERPRALQSVAGVLPSLLMAAGFAALLVHGIRRRSAPLLAVTGSVLLLGLSYLLFQQRFPAEDGDTTKAIYLLDAAVPLAVAGGFALDAVRRADGLVFAAMLLLLLGSVYLTVGFLVLPA
jgi:4-amino-4-deoxy-L-arabinose transferase-like glycosyltransferase